MDIKKLSETASTRKFMFLTLWHLVYFISFILMPEHSIAKMEKMEKSFLSHDDFTTANVPFILSMDFDQTLSKEDTTSLLFDKASEYRQNHSLDEYRKYEEIKSQVVEQHLQETRLYMQQQVIIHANCHQGINENQFDEYGLDEFLHGYSLTDLDSVYQVISKQLLSGIAHDDFDYLGRQIEFQSSTAEVLRRLSQPPYVISASWSKRMLYAAMKQHVFMEASYIISSNLEIDPSTQRTNGNIQLEVQSPQDKQRIMKSIQNKYKNQQPATPVIYIGDGINDLLALLQADIGIGIHMNSSSKGYEIGTRYGITFHSLKRRQLSACIDEAHQAKREGKRILYTASNWQEIEAFLFL